MLCVAATFRPEEPVIDPAGSSDGAGGRLLGTEVTVTRVPLLLLVEDVLDNVEELLSGLAVNEPGLFRMARLVLMTCEDGTKIGRAHV